MKLRGTTPRRSLQQNWRGSLATGALLLAMLAPATGVAHATRSADVTGVGTIQVKSIDASNGRIISGAVVSITPQGIPSAAVVADTTGADGLSAVHAFSAPGSSSVRTPGHKFWSEVTVTVSAPGYRTFQHRGVELLDQEPATEDALLLPGSGVDIMTTPPHHLFTDAVSSGQSASAAAQAPVSFPTSPGLNLATRGVAGLRHLQPGWSRPAAARADTKSRYLGYNLPATVTVHDCAASSNCANYTLSLQDYARGSLPQEWIASWGDQGGMQALYFGADEVRTYVAWTMYTCRYRCNGYNFDITSTTADQRWSSTHYSQTDNAVAATVDYYLVDPNATGNGSPINDQYRDITGCVSPSGGLPYLPSIRDQVQCDHNINYSNGPGASQWGSFWWAQAGQNSPFMIGHYYTSNTFGAHTG